MRKLATTILSLGAAGYWMATRNLEKIKSGPDPFDVATLSRDPEGDTVWVDRPDGTRLRAVVSGTGPTVVLTHGYGASLKEWNIVMPRLVEKGHRVIAFDWRGHGETTIGRDGISPETVAADYVAVLDHFDVNDAVLVGHSTGGYLSIATLIEHPEVSDRLKGLVLVASLAGDAAVDAPQTRLQIPMIKSGVMQAVAGTELLGYPFAASIWGPDPSPAALRVFLDVFLTADHSRLVPTLERLASTSYYDRLHTIPVPTVVICGEQDSTTPRWHSEAMARDIPNATNVWVPDAGHMLNWQAPDVLVSAIENLQPA